MHFTPSTSSSRLVAATAAILLTATGVSPRNPLLAQGRGRGAAEAHKNGPWFGVALPPPPGKEPAVIVGDRAPRPVTLPPGETATPELTAANIRADLDTIVGLSKESRGSQEFGSGQMWGRISGFPSGEQDDRLGGRAVPQGRHQGRQACSRSRRTRVRASGCRCLGGQAARRSGVRSWHRRRRPGIGDAVSPSDIPGGTMTAPLVLSARPIQP